MATELVFTDSFAHWDTTAPTAKWTSINIVGDVTVGSAYGRNSKGARLRTGNYDYGSSAGENRTTGNGSAILEKTFPDLTSTSWTVGFAFRFSDVISVLNMPIVQIIDTNYLLYFNGTYYEPQCSLMLTPQQQFYFIRGDWQSFNTAQIGGPSPAIRRGVYYQAEVKFILGAAGVGAVSLKIDGKQVISQTGINTLGGRSDHGNGVRLFHPKMYNTIFASGVRSWHIADVYIVTGDLSLADARVEGQVPSADGSTLAWTDTPTPHFSLLNDNPPNGDTSKISSTSAPVVDSFTFPTFPVSPATIRGVGINADVRAPTGSTGQASGVVKIGASFSSTAKKNLTAAGTTGYNGIYFGFLTDPTTGSNFSVSQLNANEFGISRDS